MFTKPKVEETNDLDEFATIIKQKLVDDNVTPEEFAKIFAEYNKLAAMQHANKRDSKVSADVLATIGANLLGIILILKHEQMNVVTSKALSFIMKLK